MKRRLGSLTFEDKEFIRENAGKMTDAQIGEVLNRRPDPIRKYRLKFIGSGNDQKSQLEAEARINLRNRPEWIFWKRQFTEEELIYLEHAYAKLVAQFSNNVTTTEEKQIFQIIELEILGNSLKEERRRSLNDIKRMNADLSAEYRKPKEERDEQRIINIENLLAAADSANHSRFSDFKVIIEKSQALLNDLKATRNQRLKHIEDNRRNLLDYIKELENEEFRGMEGREMELMSLAAKKERDRLSAYHEYIDGNIDRPILNSDTVMLDEES